MSKAWPPDVGLNADGTVDEIVLRDADGNVLFHLEKMDDTYFWFGFYGGPKDAQGHDQEIRGWIGSTSGRARVHCALPDGLPKEGA